ncbi:MAG: class I SAM-dependent methyltransferase [Gammaproteobacteria bacterium]
MISADGDRAFVGSIPDVYEELMVPLIFETYATDLAGRLAGKHLSSVLEIAAGTGVLTRRLASALPDTVSIVATDLNQPMLDRAIAIGTRRAVNWRLADALSLPFADSSFDAVVCQFGVMFFPDRPRGYSEARRVLKPGGLFLFNVWDRIEENDFARVTASALDSIFPQAPPQFLRRAPHGYHDALVIERDLAAGGFTARMQFDTLAARSRASSPHIPAAAYCQGTPLRAEIEAHGAAQLGVATEQVADAIAERFGRDAVDGKIQAHIVSVAR